MSRELTHWIAQLFSDTALTGMGHAQTVTYFSTTACASVCRASTMPITPICTR
jgi:hypothetical protein